MRRTIISALILLTLSGGGTLAAAQVLQVPYPRVGPRG